MRRDRIHSLRITATIVAAIALGLVSGCRDRPWEPGSTRDLLVREPRRVIEDFGVAVPDDETQWGALGRESWERETLRDGDGKPFAVCHGLVAKLTLPATSPAARTLRLEAWLHTSEPEEGREVPATVTLNGVELGTLELGTAPSASELTVDEGVFRRGTNELTITVQVGLYRDPTEGIALARIEAGEPLRPARRPHGWSLPSGTGVVWAIESYSPARLALGGRTSGRGALAIRFSRFDPVAGRRVEDDAPPFTARTDGELDVQVPVPTSPGFVVEVELAWSGDGDAAFELTRAEVLDRAAVTRPNIVFVSIDTLSARHMSLYGYPRRTTPRLEELAREATVFDAARTNAPWTVPSYVSVLTGLYPSSVSMDLGGWESRFMIRMPEGRWTLAEALAASGYHTGGFVDVLHLDERFGFAQGFEHFDASAAEISLEKAEGGLVHIVPRALEWLDGLPDGEPFFLFVHAYDVHGPYLPAEPWKGRFSGDELAGADDEMWAATLPHTFGSIPDYISVVPGADGGPGERIRSAPFVAGYDEEILAVDEVLGGLFDQLDARGLLRDAVVVVSADHGESTDDHDYFGHGLLYEEVLHVPLVIRLPDSMRDERVPARVRETVQLVDLYPTLLRLAGHGDAREHLHGRSLLPALHGETLLPRPTFSEGGVMRQSALEYDGWKIIESSPGTESLPWTMLSNPRLAADWVEEHAPEVAGEPMTLEVFNRILEGRSDDEVLAFLDRLREELGGPVYELYDLRNDPGEERDLAASRPEKLAELKRLLRAAQAEREESRKLLEDSLVPLSASDLEELGKLGYVEND